MESDEAPADHRRDSVVDLSGSGGVTPGPVRGSQGHSVPRILGDRRKTVGRQQFDEGAKALTIATPASGRQVSLRSAGGVLEVTPDD